MRRNISPRQVKIFISYRRDDSRTITGRICDRLVPAFGKVNVFKDVDAIKPGETFPQIIQDKLGVTDVLLVVIGQNWLNTLDKYGKRRLDDPNDYVRFEVLMGLTRSTIRVIPVLVDQATMPIAILEKDDLLLKE